MQKRLIAVVLAAFLASAAAAQTPPPADHAWVQYVAGGLELRAVTSASACPSAAIDGQPGTMTVRAAPSAEFSVLA
jgi:hypothetical protein